MNALLTPCFEGDLERPVSQMENAEIIQLINSDLAIDLVQQISYAELHRELTIYLNQLIKNDFDKLVSYLYRIDVNEQKLKTLLQQNPREDAGNLIASLIIERQQQKIKSRDHYFTNPNDNLPAGQAGFDEEEKW